MGTHKINADIDVAGEVQGTSLDINGAADISGALTVDGSVLNLTAPDLGSAPAMTATLNMRGYEGRGIGVKMRPHVTSASSATNAEWFMGSGYATSGFNIGYAADGSQSSYSAQAKLSIGTNGNATFAGTIGSGAITSTGQITGTEIEGTSLDINGNADISGNLTGCAYQGDVIASAYLDADTAHLSTTQTFTGTKTFSGQITTGYGVNFTNGSTNFLLYNNPNENVLYMRDTTNGAMVTTWGVNGFSVTGDLTVSGGDITLGGTGRIQGIDTVSADTDAANKTYVDNAVSSAGGGDVTLSGSQTFTGAKTFGAATQFNNTVTVGADTSGHDVKFFGNATGEYMQWDESSSKLNIRHDTDDSGLTIFTVSSASMTQPQLQVGRDSGQYWGVYTDDRNAHMVHRQDETSGVMTTRFDQWDSNTSDTTGSWLWRFGNGTGGSMATALTLTQAGVLTATTFSGNLNGTINTATTATTQSASDNSTKVATTAYVDAQVATVVDSAPGTLNTLNELAAALGDDASFSTTVTNSIAAKLPLAGGTMSGAIAMGDNDVTGLDELIFSNGTKLGDDGGNHYLKLTYGNSGAGGILVYDGDGTRQGWLYADGGTTPSFGLLDGSGSWAVRCLKDSYVELRYDNAVKLQTAAGGVLVTGELEATTLDINGNADISGALTLGTVLAAAEGGTGLSSISTLLNSNVTSVSGASGSCEGNAATATKISSITNSNIVQLAASQTLTNKTIAASQVTEISNITASEGAQLENIGSTTISATQWGYLGAATGAITNTDTNTQLSNAEVRAATAAATDSQVFTDADHTKLNGIATNATADQTNVSGTAGSISGITNSNIVQLATTTTQTGTKTFSGVVDITNTTDSTNATGDTGALRTEGGASIAKKLYVGSTITGSADVIAFSDRKLKENIETLDGKKVLDMRGVSFTRKDTGAESSGVIAQEIQKVAPELVHDTEGTLGVAYGNLVGYLIEAVKDQQKQIDELKKLCNGCSR